MALASSQPPPTSLLVTADALIDHLLHHCAYAACAACSFELRLSLLLCVCVSSALLSFVWAAPPALPAQRDISLSLRRNASRVSIKCGPPPAASTEATDCQRNPWPRFRQTPKKATNRKERNQSLSQSCVKAKLRRCPCSMALATIILLWLQSSFIRCHEGGTTAGLLWPQP